MMQNLLYIVVGVILYTFADWYIRRYLDRHYGSK